MVRSLVESDTADCLLKNPSPLDGVAYTAAGVLLNGGITNGIDPQIDPLDNLVTFVAIPYVRSAILPPPLRNR